MSAAKRILLQSNVAVVASDALVSRKQRSDVTTDLLAEAVMPYVEEVRLHLLEKGKELPTASEEWVELGVATGVAAGSAVAETKPDERLLPKVIEFDELLGAPVSAQEIRTEDGVVGATESAAVPWKEWMRSRAALQLDEDSAAVAAVSLVLRSLHRNGKVADQAVDVALNLESKQRTVRASEDMEEGALQLPPCVPLSGRAHKTSVHPHRVAITVTSKDVVTKRLTTKEDASAGVALAERSTTVYVHPEYKVPSDQTPESAVADGLAPGVRVWKWDGDESLHPFWAIQRLSADEMKKRSSKDPQLRSGRRFNVSLTEKQYNVVSVGDLRGHSVAMTTQVSVPMITNETKIAAGEELILEVAPKAYTKRRTDVSWKDDVVAAKAAKTKAKAKASSKAASSTAIESEV